MSLFAPTPALAAIALALMTGTALADGIVITGEVSYRERIALPPNAVATIQLVDVSLADAPAIVLAQDMIDPAGQVPIDFSLTVDDSAIVAGHTYGLSARIEADGELWFINDTHIAVDPLTHVGAIEIALVRVVAQPEADGLIGTSWSLSLLGDQPAAAGVETTLIFGEDGSAGGSGGCNVYGGTASFEGGTSLTVTEVFSTMMACEDPKMDQERGFFDALANTASYAIDGTELRLLGADGEALAVLDAL